MEEAGSEYWKKFLREHVSMVALFIVAVVLAAVGAIIVFLWFIGNAQSTHLVPTTLGLWSMRHLITFILHAIFWELILIGIPVIMAAAAGWLWWRRLPSDEKMEYHFFGKGPRRASGGGAASLLLFIAFCIKVYIDGNWNVAIGSWTLNYVVYSILWILIWIVIVFGIPAAIAAIWWINHEMKKKPQNPFSLAFFFVFNPPNPRILNTFPPNRSSNPHQIQNNDIVRHTARNSLVNLNRQLLRSQRPLCFPKNGHNKRRTHFP